MKNHHYDDLLPEEREHPELVQQLQEVYQVTPEESQSIMRIRERWHAMQADPLVLTRPEPFSSREPEGQNKGKVLPLPRASRPWIRSLNLVAAVLIVFLLVSALAGSFVILKSSTHQPPAAGIRTDGKGRSGVVLTSGLRLDMVNQQNGWAVGVGPARYNNPFGSVLRTTDGGRHWKTVTPPGLPNSEVSALYILDAKTAWLPARVNAHLMWLYRTIDGGVSWQQFILPASGVNLPIPTFVDQDHGWMIDEPPAQPVDPTQSVQSTRKSFLLQTSDGGKTWQRGGQLPVSQGGLQFLDRQTGWLTSSFSSSSKGQPFSIRTALYITHDGGHTWKPQALLDAQGRPESKQPAFLQGPTFFNQLQGYIVASFATTPSGSEEALYTTQDGGNTWLRSSGTLPGSADPRGFVDGQHIMGLGGSDVSHLILVKIVHTDGQWSATPLNLPAAKGEFAGYSFSSLQTGIVLIKVTERIIDVYQTTDGAKTWHKIATL